MRHAPAGASPCTTATSHLHSSVDGWGAGAEEGGECSLDHAHVSPLGGVHQRTHAVLRFNNVHINALQKSRPATATAPSGRASLASASHFYSRSPGATRRGWRSLHSANAELTPRQTRGEIFVPVPLGAVSTKRRTLLRVFLCDTRHRHGSNHTFNRATKDQLESNQA
jgi:hypothetical protein